MGKLVIAVPYDSSMRILEHADHLNLDKATEIAMSVHLKDKDGYTILQASLPNEHREMVSHNLLYLDHIDKRDYKTILEKVDILYMVNTKQHGETVKRFEEGSWRSVHWNPQHTQKGAFRTRQIL